MGLQGHVVAEQQEKLLLQHYHDKLPPQATVQPDHHDEAGPLTVNWQEEGSVTIAGASTASLKCSFQ